MQPPRTRPRRPVLNAIKNPCSCAMRNPVVAGPGVTQTQPQFQTPQAQNQQWWNIAANTAVGSLGDAWLPATSGPQPPGASVWVVWSGGGTGTRRVAGSNASQSVQILQTMQGGPSGVMVLARSAMGFAVA